MGFKCYLTQSNPMRHSETYQTCPEGSNVFLHVGSDPIREWSKLKLPLGWLFKEWSKLKRIRTAGVVDGGSSYHDLPNGKVIAD